MTRFIELEDEHGDKHIYELPYNVDGMVVDIPRAALIVLGIAALMAIVGAVFIWGVWHWI